MIRKKMKKIWLIILPISILMFFPFLIKAEKEISIFVSPELFELEVERGEILENKINIYNKSEFPLPIEVRVTNFGAQEESGAITFFEEPIPRQGKEDDTSYNPRKWIKIENPNFILDSGETEKVRFSVEIPEDAEPGGHYAVVIFEPKLPSFYFEEEALKVIPKIGVLFLFSVNVEGLVRVEQPITVVEFDIPENLHLKKLENFVVSFAGLFTEVWAAEKKVFSIVETSHLSFTLRIKNNDIYHIKPKGELVILTNNGKIAGETEIPKTTILPGKIRRFPVEFKPELSEKLEKYLPAALSNFISQNLFWGKYQASLVLTTKSDIIEENIEFWIFPWKFGFSTALLFALIMFFVVKYRQRIKIAIRVLMRR